MEVSVSLMEFLLQTQESFSELFLFEISYFTMFFKWLEFSKLFRNALWGIVKKYTADLTLRTKLKKIIGMKEKFAQNMELPVSLMEFLLETQGSFGGFFCWKFYIL